MIKPPIKSTTIIALSLATALAGSSTASADPILDTNVQNQGIIHLDEDSIDAANDFAAESGEAPLPQTVQTIIPTSSGFAPGDSEGRQILQSKSAWGTAWRVTKCAAAITVALAPAGAAFRAVRALGGVTATARLLVGAGSAREFMAIGGGAAAEILGISGVQENCF